MAQQPLQECSASAADLAQQLVPPLPSVRIASGYQAVGTSLEAEAERGVEGGDSRYQAPSPTIKPAVADAVGREPLETGYHRTEEAASMQGRTSSHQVTESYKIASQNSKQSRKAVLQFSLFSNAPAYRPGLAAPVSEERN